MIPDELRGVASRLRPSRRRSDLCVVAYCHAFGGDSPVADGGHGDDAR